MDNAPDPSHSTSLPWYSHKLCTLESELIVLSRKRCGVSSMHRSTWQVSFVGGNILHRAGADQISRTAGSVDNGLSHLRHAFIGLHISGGLVLLPILILTLLLSRRIQSPQPVLINFLWTWVLNSIGYLLL